MVDRLTLLEMDIDCRLGPELWQQAAEVDEWTLDLVATFMRAAFGRGYTDALTEPVPATLCRQHGYRAPERRAA